MLRWVHSLVVGAGLFIFVVPLGGCTSLREYITNGFKVGPNYCKPPAPVAKNWIDADDHACGNRPTN